ncbi:MAG: arginine N-succinyltransferase [Bradymonadia bacterium]|jgi:arginine N-succinyltransferase
MYIIRPARSADLDALLVLAETAGGLTTLPADRELLAQRIQDADHAFRPVIRKPAGDAYLFVLENLLTGAVEGCSGIVARVGGFEPFYTYALRSETKRAEALGVARQIDALHLEAPHKGPSEIGTLFVHPAARGKGIGRLVSLSRFAFMAAFPQRFADDVIAEVRGVLDDAGQSPFWDAIGRHFFDMEFAQADARSAADKSFIADLMPKHPIYLPMLPPDARAAVGEVHRDARPAKHLLVQEGFVYNQQVDIFDGGPLMRVRRDAVRTIDQSATATLAGVMPPIDGPGLFIISNDRLDFRATLGAVDLRDDGTLALPRDVVLALGLRIGDAVRYVTARSAAEATRG